MEGKTMGSTLNEYMVLKTKGEPLTLYTK